MLRRKINGVIKRAKRKLNFPKEDLVKKTIEIVPGYDNIEDYYYNAPAEIVAPKIEEKPVVEKIKLKLGERPVLVNPEPFKPQGPQEGKGKYSFYHYDEKDALGTKNDGIYAANNRGGGNGWVYSIIGENNQLVLPLVQCKDFFNDIIFAQIWGVGIPEITNFYSYKGINPACGYRIKNYHCLIDFDKPFRIVVSHLQAHGQPKFTYIRKFYTAFKILKKLYKEIGLEKPKILARFNTEKGNTNFPYFVIELPNVIFKYPPIISLTQEILRLDIDKLILIRNNLNTIDQILTYANIKLSKSYFHNISFTLNFFRENKLDKIFEGKLEENWPIGISSGYGIHGIFGFYSMLSYWFFKIPYRSNITLRPDYLKLLEAQK